jgi:ribosomal protein S4
MTQYGFDKPKKFTKLFSQVKKKRTFKVYLLVKTVESRIIFVLVKMNFVSNSSLATYLVNAKQVLLNSQIAENVGTKVCTKDFIHISQSSHRRLKKGKK